MLGARRNVTDDQNQYQMRALARQDYIARRADPGRLHRGDAEKTGARTRRSRPVRIVRAGPLRRLDRQHKLERRHHVSDAALHEAEMRREARQLGGLAQQRR